MISRFLSFPLQLCMNLHRSVRKACFGSGFFTPFLSKLRTCCLYDVNSPTYMLLFCATWYPEITLIILFFFPRRSIRLHLPILLLPVNSNLLAHFPTDPSIVFLPGFHNVLYFSSLFDSTLMLAYLFSSLIVSLINWLKVGLVVSQCVSTNQ